jgi:hypothetical protein
VDDLRRRKDQLAKELQHIREAFTKEYRSTTSAWGGTLGPFTIDARISAEIIIAIYVTFNVVCFVAGVAFIFQRGVLQTLGISLVVGALFSFGTFMAQWWNHAWQIRHDTLDRSYNPGYKDKRYSELQRLVKEYNKLYEELKALPEQTSQDSIPKPPELPPGPILPPPPLSPL